MKQKWIIGCLVTLLLLLQRQAVAQFQGHIIYGTSDEGEYATAIAHRDEGDCIIVGGFSAFQPTFRQVGMEMKEPLNGPPFSVTTHSLIDVNHGTCVMRAVADGVGTGFNAMVGDYTLMGQTQTGGIFFDRGSGDDFDLTAVHWEGAGNQHLHDVVELQDHSFVVVGSSVVGNVQHSIVTRLSARPSYAPIFTRQLGLPQNTGFLVDEARAVVQLPDGNLLIGGNTRHFSTSAQGSIYLMKMALDGTVLAFSTYTMPSDVVQPRMAKLAVLGTGSIVVVGSSLLTNLTEHKGFVMQVSSNLATASYTEFSQPVPSAIGLELQAVIALPGTDEYFVGGYIQQSVFNTVEKNPLIMRASASTGVSKVRRVHNPGIVSEEYADLALLANNTILEAVGSTRQPRTGSNDPANLNILTSRMPLDLNFCTVNAQSLTIVPKVVTIVAGGPSTTLTQPTFMGTIGFLTVSSRHELFCQSSKMAETELEPAHTISLFPNPATSTATLQIPGLEGLAHVQICDATGRVLARWDTDKPETMLDLTSFAKGILLVRISTAQQLFTQKLILQ